MDVQIFLSDLISRLDIPSSLRTYNRQNRLCCLFQDKYLFFCKVLYRVTSLCKSVHFVFYFYTRSLFFENCCTVSLFLQPVHPNHFCYVRNLLVCIFVDHSHPICLILFFANNHSESLFFCKLRSLRMECQESPIRERQDCSKRVPSEAKPL